MIHYRILKVADIGESAVDDRIGHLIANSTNPTVGVLAHPGQVDVRIAALAESVDEANALGLILNAHLLDARKLTLAEAAVGGDEVKHRRGMLGEPCRLNGFATGLRYSGDTEFLYRAVFDGRIRNSPDFSYFHRIIIT